MSENTPIRFEFGHAVKGIITDYRGSTFEHDQSFYLYEMTLHDGSKLNVIADEQLPMNQRLKAQSCGAYQPVSLSKEFRSTMLTKIESDPPLKDIVISRLKRALLKSLGF